MPYGPPAVFWTRCYIPEGGSCGGRQGSDMEEQALHGARGHPTPSQRPSSTLQRRKVRSLWFWPFHVALLSGITGVSNHMECTLLFHAFCSDRSSLCFDSVQRCSSIVNDPKPVSKTSPWETQMFLGTSEWGKPIQDVWVTNRSRKFQQQIAHELDYGVPFPHCVKRCTFCRHCLFLAFWDFRFRR